MSFLRNTWYVAAWADEVSQSPIKRTLLDLEMVLFRKENGEPVALGNMCPHRFAPLSMGRVVGDNIECPYHGLQFNSEGGCAFSPLGKGSVPPKAQVPAFRVEERHQLIWFWAGNPELADPSLIPVLDYLDDPNKRTVNGCLGVNANYLLYVDNLIDLTHAQFVHGDQLGVENFHNAEVGVTQDGEDVTVEIAIPDSEVPPVLATMVGETEARGTFNLKAKWQVPSIVTNDVQFQENQAEEPLFRSFGTHILTPESMHSAHYFYGLTREFALDDEEADARARAWHLKGFNEQDKPIIEEVARLMGDELDPVAMSTAALPADGGNVRVRRILNERIRQEAAGGS